MQYNPGLHLLLNIRTEDSKKLSGVAVWEHFINEQILQLNLNKVGEVLHDFPEGGYTAIHALTESHVSIHTWPEFNFCTCDIFLSNFNNNNHEKVRTIGKAILHFFESEDADWKEVER